MCDLTGCGSNATTMPLPKVTDEQRRGFLKGAMALPLASVLAYPELARAAAATTSDLQAVTPSGLKIKGALAIPEKTPAPAVLLIHEWWGLNDQIKSVAAEFARNGYMALAIDMYNSEAATSREGAMKLMKGADPKQSVERLKFVIDWLKKHKQSTGKVGTIGWCFGGGWSLNASLATPVDATVIYYGNVRKSAAQLAPLQSPVLGHFGTLDKRINKEMVGGFEAALKEAGKTDATMHWYDADHAFANPTGSRYDAEDAALAWQRTMTFFKQHLG